MQVSKVDSAGIVSRIQDPGVVKLVLRVRSMETQFARVRGQITGVYTSGGGPNSAGGAERRQSGGDHERSGRVRPRVRVSDHAAALGQSSRRIEHRRRLGVVRRRGSRERRSRSTETGWALRSTDRADPRRQRSWPSRARPKRPARPAPARDRRARRTHGSCTTSGASSGKP